MNKIPQDTTLTLVKKELFAVIQRKSLSAHPTRPLLHVAREYEIKCQNPLRSDPDTVWNSREERVDKSRTMRTQTDGVYFGMGHGAVLRKIRKTAVGNEQTCLM